MRPDTARHYHSDSPRGSLVKRGRIAPTFRDLLETAHSRPLIGFDAFGSFPRDGVAGLADRGFIDRFEAAGASGISRGDLETLPAYLERRPALKVALLQLDVDVYEPTAFALELSLPRMVRGGLVVFDDYGLVDGATRAADEACDSLGLGMAKLSNYVIPGYFRVP